MRLLWKSRKDSNYRQRWRERLGIIRYNGKKEGIWIHAVSVGEVIAAVPLIKELQKKFNNIPVIVTTMTPSGSERVNSLFGDSVFHVYLPYDLSCSISVFLDKIKPKILIIIETEIWPNLIRICSDRKIPVIINNARMSKRSARKYAKFSSITKCIFKKLHIAAISKQDARRFCFLGSHKKNIQITGSIKYDFKLPNDFAKKRASIEKYLINKNILLAASTHANEEEIILGIYKKLLTKHPNLTLFLIPRHPPRAKDVFAICKKQGFKSVFRTKIEEISSDTNVIVGDTIGELLLFYSFAEVVFIGGSLIEHGGHNPLEAAIFGKAIIVGEYIFNFEEIYHMFSKHSGCLITKQKDLFSCFDQVLSDASYRQILEKNSKKIFEKNGGALQKQIEVIKKLL